MRNLILFLILIPIAAYGQEDYRKAYFKADSLIKNHSVENGYLELKKLESLVSESDTLYNYVLWYYTFVVTHLESINRMGENFDNSLKYGLEALEAIRKGKERFDTEFAKREPFMIKNIIVSYFGLDKYDEAKKYKDLLYQSYKDKSLPDGINEFFNFDYFKWENKNIWGYEWYADLPKDRFGSSFTKVVYYVYSTNQDGSDKDQLYRLHVLMFHGSNNNFDYVLTKRMETDTTTTGGTLYAYTYKEDIDYKKLKSDIKEVLKGNLQPDTKTTIPKRPDKDGKIKVDVDVNLNEKN